MTRRIPEGRSGFLVALLITAGCAGAGSTSGPSPRGGEYDVVIINGRIADGTGAAWFRGDIAVQGDRIARITPAGLLKDAATRVRIDARDHVVAPGFIDIQGQSQGALLTGAGRLVSKITQGVTTEILGEGKGAAQGVPNAAELDSMRKVVRWAVEGGAFGIASALIYPPGSFATTEEVIEAAKAMAPCGGIYITHLRSEGDQLLEAMDEAIRIGREAGVPVESYQLKDPGMRNWPKARMAIAKIDSPRAAGLDLQAVRKLTSAVTTRLGIQDRGLLREGMHADSVVSDPATVVGHATFEQPHQLSTGIEHVFLNGVAVVRDGRVTGAKPGRALRGPGYTGE